MRRIILSFAVLVLSFVFGALTMHFGMHGSQTADMDALRAQVTIAQAGQADAHTELATVRSQLQVELGTRQALETSLLGVQQELGRTRDQLAFYEQLIPPAPAGSVAIRAFDVQQQDELLNYRVLLSRNAPGQPAFKGRMRFTAKGLQAQKTVKIELTAAALGQSAAPSDSQQSPGVEPFALAFDQFQRSTGILRIPPDFIPESVTLDILEGGVIRATRDLGMDGTAVTPEQAIGVSK